MAAPKKLSQLEAGLIHGWRSGLEEDIGEYLKEHNIAFLFEGMKVPFVVNKKRTYTPDFILPNYIVVESKGRFTVEDRGKMKMVKAQHPHLDLRLVFDNPNARINKLSETRYFNWAETQGFPWAKKRPPIAWFTEEPNPKAKEAVIALLGYKPDFCL